MRGFITREIKEEVVIKDLQNKILDSKYYKIIRILGIVIYRYDYNILNDTRYNNTGGQIGFKK
jgi:hypothetical protein